MSHNESLDTLQDAGKGTVVAIRGGVVSVRFPEPVPQIRELLYAGKIALEVAALEDRGVVRCMALAPVKGLGLGMPVRATGSPITVPVGDAILGRMLNVFGAPVD
ncbi:MAG TPA: F0F1 ATP synthase subunit beta, partial [Marinobacter adhaerens]|nr:F0F1 ATP synthase subunit beta [Marinobacter adhaerens]